MVKITCLDSNWNYQICKKRQEQIYIVEEINLNKPRTNTDDRKLAAKNNKPVTIMLPGYLPTKKWKALFVLYGPLHQCI